MSTKTTHYNFNKWTEDDPVDVAEVSENFQLADDALASLASTRAKIATGTYVGTGTYGQNNPTVLNFDFEPVAVIIDCSDKTWAQSHVFVRNAPRGITYEADMALYWGTLIWDGATFKIWNADHGLYQCNAASLTYTYIAFG